MSVIRLGDYVLPRERRNITIGIGLGGWGPDSQPAKVTGISVNGGTVDCEFLIAPWGIHKGKAPDRFRTSIAGLIASTEDHARSAAALQVMSDRLYGKLLRHRDADGELLAELTRDLPDHLGDMYSWSRNPFRLPDGRTARVHITLEVDEPRVSGSVLPREGAAS